MRELKKIIPGLLSKLPAQARLNFLPDGHGATELRFKESVGVYFDETSACRGGPLIFAAKAQFINVKSADLSRLRLFKKSLDEPVASWCD